MNQRTAFIAAFAFSLIVVPAAVAPGGSADSTGATSPARLFISSDADSSEVYIDGNLAGVTPLAMDSLAAGAHTLLVLSKNPASWFVKKDSVSVILVPGELRHLRFSMLSPLRLRPARLPEISPLLGDAGQQNGRTLAIFASGGVTVAAGVVAAYYKTAADDRNEAYLSTGNSALLDERRRFDTIAGIALVAMQVGFAVFSYLLLTE